MQGQTQVRKSQEPLSRLPSQQHQSATSYRKTLCDKPRSRDDWDVCQQFRIADAAEHQSRLMEWEVGWLIPSVIFTALAAIAAAVAAWSAEKAIRITSDTAKRQLRAYIDLHEAKITMQPDGHFETRVLLQNGGLTPAYQVIANISMIAIPYPLVNDLPPPDDYVGRHSKSTIGPQRAVRKMMTCVRPLSSDDQLHIANETAAIFTYGRLTYKDIFKESHRTDFRCMYVGHWGGELDMEICEDGNDSD